MANTFIKSTTKFKPFSYQEMLAPVLAYKEAYDKADENLTALYEDAATKAFNFAAQDGKEKAIYNDMMNRLQTASDALHSGDKTAFKDISNINKEYRQTMIPIQLKLAKRAELIKEQRDKQAANDKLRFSVDYSKESLDNISASSTYETYNLDTIYKNIGTEFAGLVSGYVRDNLPMQRIGNTDHYVYTSGIGYTKEEIENAFYGKDGNPDINSPIYQYYKKKADEIDTIKGLDVNTKNDMKNTIKASMIANSGTFKSQVLTDPYYKHVKDALKQDPKDTEVTLVSLNSNNPEKIESAVVKLGNQLFTVDVIGLQKDENGEYKKDNKGNYIPIYGSNIKKPYTDVKPPQGYKLDKVTEIDSNGRKHEVTLKIYEDGTREEVSRVPAESVGGYSPSLIENATLGGTK